MREIKFRAWHKQDKKMVTVNEIHFGPGHVFFRFNELLDDGESDWALLRDVELMQYTGLKDVNRQEIFEGDIVRWEGAGTVFTRPVVWDVGEAMFLPNSMSGDVEVIGNIYEHHELLEKQHPLAT